MRRAIKTHRSTVRPPRLTEARSTITRTFALSTPCRSQQRRVGRPTLTAPSILRRTTPRQHHLNCHRCAPPPCHHLSVRRVSSCQCARRHLCVCDCSSVRLFSTSFLMAMVVVCTRLFTHLTLTITLQLTCISAKIAHSHLSHTHTHKLKRSPSHTRPCALSVTHRPAST